MKFVACGANFYLQMHFALVVANYKTCRETRLNGSRNAIRRGLCAAKRCHVQVMCQGYVPMFGVMCQASLGHEPHRWSLYNEIVQLY